MAKWTKEMRRAWHKKMMDAKAAKTGKQKKTTKPKQKYAAEKKKYKDFTGRTQANVTHKNISWPSKLIFVGIAKDLTYSSDKQVGALKGGIMRNYIHEFKKHGKIYTNPEGTMFVITDVKTKMKKEGITG